MSLRKDGMCILFHVQHQWKQRGEWADSNVGNFMFEPLTYDKRLEDGDRLRAMIHPYSSDVDPYQVWGIPNSWLTLEDARKVMRDCEKKNPMHSFRVISRVISQTTIILAENGL